MKIAITRQVSPIINQCELTYIEREPIDYQAIAYNQVWDNAAASSSHRQREY